MPKDAAAHVAQSLQADPGKAIDIRISQKPPQDHHARHQKRQPDKIVDARSLCCRRPLEQLRLVEFPVECSVPDPLDHQWDAAIGCCIADACKQPQGQPPLVGGQKPDKLSGRPPAFRQEPQG